MSKRERLLLFFLFFTCVAWGLLVGFQSLPKWMGTSDAALQKRIAASSSSIVYKLEPSRWLEFSLPAGTDIVRIISNASIETSMPTEPTDTWQYAIRYQLVGSNGEVLEEDTYHKRTGLNQIDDPLSGESFTPTFYLSDNLTPTNGQIFLLNFVDKPDVRKLRVRLVNTIHPLQDVVIRAYYHEKIPAHKFKLMWKRMSEDRKVNLAQGNIYAHDMLTEEEKNNLLSKQQLPLSPRGIEGYAYESKVLYSMKAYEGQRVYESIPLMGVQVDAHFRGVIPIPERGGKIRLNFEPASYQSIPHESQLIYVRWYGRKAIERVSHEIPWHGRVSHFEHHFDGGLLEIESNDSIVVRAHLIEAERETEITLQTMYLRGYVVRDHAPVEYKVVHTDSRPTPFRMDFRYFVPDISIDNAEHQSLVEYSFLDDEGSLIKKGYMPLSTTASIYDRVAGDSTGIILSDPVSYYFSLPPNVAKVQFRSVGPVLVFIYNRPADLAHELKVPENAYVSDMDEWRQPVWFPVRPISYENLILENRSVLMTTQYRPPEDKLDLLAGRYQWEDYHPQGNWLARHIYVPLEDVGSIRKEAIPAIYRELTLGQEEVFNFHAPYGMQTIVPKLAYFRQDDNPSEITVFINDQLHYKSQANGKQGEIQLPVLPIGQHKVKVMMSVSGKLFLSNTEPVQGSVLKRLVNQFDQNGLDFVYDRTSLEEEVLSVRLHVPYGVEGRSKIRVSMVNMAPLPLKPLAGWSLGVYRFDIRPDMTIPVPILGTDFDFVDRGQSFFIPLGEELPVGKYRFHFELEQGDGGYLSLSKVTPGVFQERNIFQEMEMTNAYSNE